MSELKTINAANLQVAFHTATVAVPRPDRLTCSQYPLLVMMRGLATSFQTHMSELDLPEKVAGVSIKLRVNSQDWLYVGYPKARHHHLIAAMFEVQGSAYSPTNVTNQGFLSSHGRHLSRREARQIAEEHDQLLKGALRHRELFSEDIW